MFLNYIEMKIKDFTFPYFDFTNKIKIIEEQFKIRHIYIIICFISSYNNPHMYYLFS